MTTSKKQQRRENLTNYLESFFSENQIRQLYAIFLSGGNPKQYSYKEKRPDLSGDYKGCHHSCKAAAATLMYDDVINELVTGWDRATNK